MLTKLFGWRFRSSDCSQNSVQDPRVLWRRFAYAVVVLALTITIGCNRQQTQISRHLDFNQDVQPILASRCFSCHGPDPEMRKAGLRLDLAEWAMRKREGHRDAIVPGHPEKSELVKRIESKDPHYLMPQNAQGEAKPMSAGEIAILKEWINKARSIVRIGLLKRRFDQLFLTMRKVTLGPGTRSTISSSRNWTNKVCSLLPRRTSRLSFDE